MKLLFICLLMISGCKLIDGNNISAGVEDVALIQHWVHSFEEDSGDEEMIFRPKDGRVFPPSRFRKQYIFSGDGTCEWYYLAPNDGHYFRDGVWRLESEKILLIEEGEDTIRYRITKLSQEELRLEYLLE